MEKISYSIKTLFQKIKSFFTSTEFLKKYDKFRKIMKKVIPAIVVYGLLICFCYVFVYPILRVFVDSLKTEADVSNPDIAWIPTSIYWKNYSRASDNLKLFLVYKDGNVFAGFKSTFLNSILYASINAVLQTFVAGLAGYSFARFKFPGKKFWFAGLIISFVIPSQILVMPRQMIMKDLVVFFSDPAKNIFHITNAQSQQMFYSFFSVFSTVPIMIISILGQGINSAILIFIFYGFFKMIPQDLDEAAQIDGANYAQIFYHVILKMSVSTILVVFLFSFVWNWNDTFTLSTLLFAEGVDTKYAFETLPEALGIFRYFKSQGGLGQEEYADAPNLRGAGIIISILPLAILYAVAQRKFVEGIENTGVTGV